MKSYPICEGCHSALSRVIFFHETLKKVVDFCWKCFDASGKDVKGPRSMW